LTSDVVRYANGAINQCKVSWAFGGGMDLRDEVSGTERTNWREGIPSHIWKIPSSLVSGKSNLAMGEK
jgi:hypothetical protein